MMSVRGNFLYLLVSLLGFLVILAVMNQYPHFGGNRLISILIELSLVVAIWSLVRNRLWFVVGLTLIGIGAVGIILQFVFDVSGLHIINMLVVFLFYFMSTVIAFTALLSPTPIDLNKIIGSVSVYLLVGINWAFVYYFAELVSPGSFSGFSLNPEGNTTLFDLIYYSYVTLSTLGYGDITPLTPVVRMLAMVEALFGQFYIAILVAVLVGTHISAHTAGKK